MDDHTTNIDDLFDDEHKTPPVAKTRRKPPAARPPRHKPRKVAPPESADELIDTAVNIRRLDWECECGNTNTHDLTRCGKCNTHRYR